MVAPLRAAGNTSEVFASESLPSVDNTTQKAVPEAEAAKNQSGKALVVYQAPKGLEKGSPSIVESNGGKGLLGQLEALQGKAKPAPIPNTPTVQIREQHHGTLVADPYRWLELPFEQSQRVLPHQEHKIQAWIDAQNARTEQALGQDKELLTYLQQRYYAMQDRPMSRRPQKVANLGTIQWRRDAADESWKIFLRRDAGAKNAPQPQHPGQKDLFTEFATEFNAAPERISGEVLVDEKALLAKLGLAPSSFIESTSFSPGARYLALSIGEYHGDDRRTVALLDVRSGEPVAGSGLLRGVKWSQLQWFDKNRLMYAKVDLSAEELHNNAPDIWHHQMLHTVGEPQDKDIQLFKDDVSEWGHTSVWKQGKRLFRSRNTVGSDRSILESAAFDPETVLDGTVKFFPVFDAEGVEATMGFLPGTSRYLLRTRQQEDGSFTTGRIVYVDTNDPERKFETLIPSVPGREMEGATVAGGKIVVNFQVNLGRRLAVYDKKGKLEREIDFEEAGLPLGEVQIKRYDSRAGKLLVRYSSPLEASAEYEVDLKTGEVELKTPSTFPFDGSKFTVEEVSYTSKDGTEVPMLIYHGKEGYKKDGTNPTIVYGYGGFEIDIAERGFIMSSLIPFLEAGGTVALPALRGGAELGDAWHDAGKREKKQNVFDDYYGAAEAMISMGYTCPEKLAAMGASNGGLLTGAAIVQKGKALYKAVAPHAGVMDMLRFHKFSSGRWWIDEYGNPDNAEDFKNLIKYSPYHNVTDNDYPAVLVSTGLFDSRVDPSHSLKFLAALQAHQTGDAPIFGFINPDSGHWPNKHPQRQSEFLALRMAFIMGQLGMKVPE